MTAPPLRVHVVDPSAFTPPYDHALCAALAREGADVHFQWLAVQHLDARLLPRARPLVLTAHDVLPREPRPGQRTAQRRLYDRVDAVVVHSEHGRRRLVEALGVDAGRVHVIPHGAFDYL